MTNFEKWQYYLKDIPSPDNFIDWGFIFTIAAALQRRVWFPPEHRPIYPNMYVTLVAKPGVGKGMVIKPVVEMLSHWKHQDVKPKSATATTLEEQAVLAAMERLNKEDAENGDVLDLFPSSGDAVTYEGLVRKMARAIRRISYTKFDPKHGRETPQVYSHSSMYAGLEEKSSLFRKNTESLVNFLLQAYDSGEEYRYDTKDDSRKDRIRRMCFNLLAGTTPDFMQQTFDSKLLDQGYSSRVFYVYAARNRKPVMFLPELDDKQKQYKEDLLKHVFSLSQLYGQVRVSDETKKWITDWHRDMEEHPEKRSSKSLKLDAYYARKNIHVLKVAMALHFGEVTDIKAEMPLETIQRAIEFLNKEEKMMHHALTLEGKNPLAAASRGIVTYLSSTGKHNFIELLQEFWGQVDKEQMTQILNYLTETGQVIAKQEAIDGTDEKEMVYAINRTSES